MNMWVAIVLMVAIISVAQVLQARHRARHGITTDAMGNEKPLAPPTNPALEREVEELRERVKVLDRGFSWGGASEVLGVGNEKDRFQNEQPQ